MVIFNASFCNYLSMPMMVEIGEAIPRLAD